MHVVYKYIGTNLETVLNDLSVTVAPLQGNIYTDLSLAEHELFWNGISIQFMSIYEYYFYDIVIYEVNDLKFNTDYTSLFIACSIPQINYKDNLKYIIEYVLFHLK